MPTRSWSMNISSFPPQEDPACGWCDDGSNRGTGTCMPGGYRGALGTSPTTSSLALRNKSNSSTLSGFITCPASQWYFTECPPCQCNGHSTCSESNRNQCNQPCLHLTEGAHCETCIAGYFGNPVNGGTCSPCQCKWLSVVLPFEHSHCHVDV